MSRAFSMLLLGVALLACTAPMASATTFDLNVINCNCLLAGTSAGTVDVSVNGAGTTATITVQLAGGLQFHDSGLSSFAFNYAGGGTISKIDTTGVGWAVDPKPNADGFGNFSYYYSCTGAANGCNPNTDHVTFTITGTNLTEAAFETLSSGGSTSVDFSANVAVAAASGCTGVVGGGNGTGQSTAGGGYAAGSTRQSECAPTPEPTSIAFFGTGLLALGFFVRKKLAAQN